jgi:hypothetical protein
MTSFSRPKAAFLLSAAFLFFLLGFGFRAGRIPPNDSLVQAWKQAKNLFDEPHFLNDQTYDRKGVHTVGADVEHSGLTLLVSVWQTDGSWEPGIKLINQHGDIFHAWRIHPEELFPRLKDKDRVGYIHGTQLLPDGDVVFNIEPRMGTARIDACGNVQWKIAQSNHHSVDQASDGSFWISNISSRPRTKSDDFPKGYPGLDHPVYIDKILHASPKGNVIDKINVLDALYKNEMEKYINKAYISADASLPPGRVPEEDVTHLNDVEPLPSRMADEYPLFDTGDLLVSLRNLHLVFVLDPETETVKWHSSEPFTMQHDPDFMGDGWIGVFDNRRDFTDTGNMLGGSRIVAVQPHSDSLRTLFPTSLSDPFYTSVGGKWQQLDNGNLLLNEYTKGRIAEVTPDGRTVWEWIKSPTDAGKVPSVQEATRYNLTKETVSSWSCASKTVVRSPSP